MGSLLRHFTDNQSCLTIHFFGFSFCLLILEGVEASSRLPLGQGKEDTGGIWACGHVSALLALWSWYYSMFAWME